MALGALLSSHASIALGALSLASSVGMALETTLSVSGMGMSVAWVEVGPLASYVSMSVVWEKVGLLASGVGVFLFAFLALTLTSSNAYSWWWLDALSHSMCSRQHWL